MQTSNLLLLGVGALSVAAQASLPVVSQSIARFFRRHGARYATHARVG